MKLDFCLINSFKGVKNRFVFGPRLSQFGVTASFLFSYLIIGSEKNMKKVIVLSSVTYALKAQELLKNNGIYSKLTRSRSVRSIRGCGYGIAFDVLSAEKAENLIVTAGIPIIGSTEEK